MRTQPESSGYPAIERARLNVLFVPMNGQSLTLMCVDETLDRAAISICVGNVTGLS
jgi:hypothetical protein